MESVQAYDEYNKKNIPQQVIKDNVERANKGLPLTMPLKILNGRLYGAMWRKNNPDKIRGYQKRYKEYRKRYYNANKEKIAKKNKIYNEVNKEKIAKYQKAYWEAKKKKQDNNNKITISEVKNSIFKPKRSYTASKIVVQVKDKYGR